MSSRVSSLAMCDRDFTGRKVGHYFLLSRLGSGTGGSVYRGVDVTSENSHTYAVKCVIKSWNPRRRDQQLAEVTNHDAVFLCPNVLMLHEAFENDEYLVLVFPLCEMDMATAIFETGAYWKKDDLIKKTFVDLLDGILACHDKGVFHRDLKPENIMCDAKGTQIRIADFGLSSNRRVCRDGGCGTAPYMSPECLDKNGRYDANLTDIWALGVILFNMVTRHFPWEEARLEDGDYKAFLTKKNYLMLMSPVSEPLNALLRQIWHPVPMKRMSIPAIRQAIMEMDSFYEPLGLFKDPHPELSEVVVFSASSQQTWFTPVTEEKKNDSRAPVEVLEERFRRLEMMVQAW